MAKAKSQVKSAKNYTKSIRTTLLTMFGGALLVLAVALTAFSGYTLRSEMIKSEQESLKRIALAVEAGFGSLSEEPFHVENGMLYKGDINITENQELLVDPYTDGSAADVLLYYDYTCYASSMRQPDGSRLLPPREALRQEVQDTIARGEVYLNSSEPLGELNFFVCFYPVREADGRVVGMVVIGEDNSAIMADITGKILQQVTISVILILLGMAFLVWFAINLSKTIQGVEVGIDMLADGELNFLIDKKILARSDELGAVGRAIANLRERLKGIVSDIADASNELTGSGQELASMAGQTSVTADEISSAADDISNGAVSQAEDIETATMKVATMGELIEQIVYNIGKLDEVSTDMQKMGSEAGRIMGELVESNDKTAEAVQKVSVNVEATDESVNKIAEAVDLITNIASQTNLLSLNASIEAARAGEAGKGFAVVATEIQKLSEESNSSAERISEIIAVLSEDSKNSMKVMDEVKKRLADQEEKLNETKKEFEGVSQGIATSKASTDQINSQAKECDDARGVIVDIIQNLSAISEENAASTEETVASIAELTSNIKQFAEASNQIKDLSVRLQEVMSVFKL